MNQNKKFKTKKKLKQPYVSFLGVQIASPVAGKVFCLTKNFLTNENDRRQNHIEIMKEALKIGNASMV